MSEENGKWQIAFWVVTVFTIAIGTGAVSGYFDLNEAIAATKEELRSEKRQDIDKIENKIEKVDNKVDSVDAQLKILRKEQSEMRTNILVALEQIKAQIKKD